MNNFSSFEELRNNALGYKGGRSDPYEFDEESGACSSNNIMASNDYKLTNSMSVMKVRLYFLISTSFFFFLNNQIIYIY